MIASDWMPDRIAPGEGAATVGLNEPVAAASESENVHLPRSFIDEAPAAPIPASEAVPVADARPQPEPVAQPFPLAETPAPAWAEAEAEPGFLISVSEGDENLSEAWPATPKFVEPVDDFLPRPVGQSSTPSSTNALAGQSDPAPSFDQALTPSVSDEIGLPAPTSDGPEFTAADLAEPALPPRTVADVIDLSRPAVDAVPHTYPPLNVQPTDAVPLNYPPLIELANDAVPSNYPPLNEQAIDAVPFGYPPLNEQATDAVPFNYPPINDQAASWAVDVERAPTDTAGPGPQLDIATPDQVAEPQPSDEEASWLPASEAADAVTGATRPSRRRWLYVGAVAALAILVFGVLAVRSLRTNTGARKPNATPANTAPPTPVAPPNMVYVPEGRFTMGSENDDYEKPPHEVSVPAFFIDQYEVTNEDYAAFVTANGHRSPAGWTNGTFPAGAGRKPVTGVDWDDATAYAAWSGKRLPTEEEWEYAARGTDGRRYPWGNTWQDNAANADTGNKGGVVEVGSFPAGKSPFGIFDMVGNAWEWTASELKAYPNGRLPKQPVGDVRVIRGGSWYEDRTLAGASYRGSAPARGRKDYDKTGFRCAKSSP